MVGVADARAGRTPSVRPPRSRCPGTLAVAAKIARGRGGGRRHRLRHAAARSRHARDPVLAARRASEARQAGEDAAQERRRTPATPQRARRASPSTATRKASPASTCRARAGLRSPAEEGRRELRRPRRLARAERLGRDAEGRARRRREPAHRVRRAPGRPQSVPGAARRRTSRSPARFFRAAASTTSCSTRRAAERPASSRSGTGSTTSRRRREATRLLAGRRDADRSATRGSGVDPGSIGAFLDGSRTSTRVRQRRHLVHTGCLCGGKHTIKLLVSDYQETKNMEDVGPILPNTRIFTASFTSSHGAPNRACRSSAGDRGRARRSRRNPRADSSERITFRFALRRARLRPCRPRLPKYVPSRAIPLRPARRPAREERDPDDAHDAILPTPMSLSGESRGFTNSLSVHARQTARGSSSPKESARDRLDGFFPTS